MLLLKLLPTVALLFGWSTVACGFTFLAAVFFGHPDNPNCRISAAFDYTLVITIVFGAGMVVLGGVVGLWDILVALDVVQGANG